MRTWALLLGTLITIGAGCERANPSAAVDPPDPPEIFPPLSDPSALVFERTTQSAGLASRYVLNADSTFALQYGKVVAYGGRYARVDTLLAFDFEDKLGQWEWHATGALQGDSLRVEYSLVMLLDDFENGVYRRTLAR